MEVVFTSLFVSNKWVYACFVWVRIMFCERSDLVVKNLIMCKKSEISLFRNINTKRQFWLFDVTRICAKVLSKNVASCADVEHIVTYLVDVQN